MNKANKSYEREIEFVEKKWSERNENLREKVLELESQLKKTQKHIKITKNDLSATIPRLVLLTQVFGKAYETILGRDQKDLSYSDLSLKLEELCKITNQDELEKLCRYVMNNPLNLESPANKIAPKHVIEKLDDLIMGSKIYNDSDFEAMKKTIYKHKDEKAKNDLLVIMRTFSSSGGTDASSLLNVINGVRIDFDKKALLVYLMKASNSIVRISSISLNQSILEIFKTTSLNPETSKTKLKNKGSMVSHNSSTSRSNKSTLKMGHMNLDAEGELDPNSLGYKLRKALEIYLSRKVSERIEAFTRGDDIEYESDTRSKMTPEQVSQELFKRLAEFLFKKEMTLMDIIQPHVYDYVYYSRDVQLIYIDDFFKSLRDYNFSCSKSEKEDFIQVMSEKEIISRFIVDKIEIVLQSLGIKSGLPESSKFLDFSEIDYKSYRIANRLHKLLKKKGESSITNLIKTSIKEVDVQAKDRVIQVQYIEADRLNDFFKQEKIARELELPEKLNFMLCISRNNALEKIMIKKLEKFLSMTKDNTYVKSIGLKRRNDPKDDIEEDNPSKPLNTENTEDFEDYDLSEEEEIEQRQRNKEIERQKKMQETKKNRKTRVNK